MRFLKGLESILGKIKTDQREFDYSVKKEHVNYLKQLLQDTEVQTIEYHGPSEEFVKLAAENDLPFEIGEITMQGRVCDLAKWELEYLLRKENSPLSVRYWAGRALGITSKQILKHHKNYRNIPEEFSEESRIARAQLEDREVETSLTEENLAKARILNMFKEAYPLVRPYSAWKMILDRSTDPQGYELYELTA